MNVRKYKTTAEQTDACCVQRLRIKAELEKDGPPSVCEPRKRPQSKASDTGEDHVRGGTARSGAGNTLKRARHNKAAVVNKINLSFKMCRWEKRASPIWPEDPFASEGGGRGLNCRPRLKTTEMSVPLAGRRSMRAGRQRRL